MTARAGDPSASPVGARGQVELTDVTLRDGLQVESRLLSLDEKASLFDALVPCGYARLEVTSFVNPKWLPQFADAESLAPRLAAVTGRPELMAFVPNEKGLERLLPLPIEWAAAFVAVTEAFNKKNVNMTVDESLQGLERTCRRAREAKRRIRVYISTVFGCPYQGRVAAADRKPVFERVAAMAPDEIALGDTIGVATPAQVQEVLRELAANYPVERTALHFHNTYGLAVASAFAGYQSGVRKFDGATGGIGGCPYARGATGNIATEELAYAFFREQCYPAFASAAFAAALDRLRSLGLPIRSQLGEVQGKGGQWYGV